MHINSNGFTSWLWMDTRALSCARLNNASLCPRTQSRIWNTYISSVKGYIYIYISTEPEIQKGEDVFSHNISKGVL